MGRPHTGPNVGSQKQSTPDTAPLHVNVGNFNFAPRTQVHVGSEMGDDNDFDRATELEDSGEASSYYYEEEEQP